MSMTRDGYGRECCYCGGIARKDITKLTRFERPKGRGEFAKFGGYGWFCEGCVTDYSIVEETHSPREEKDEPKPFSVQYVARSGRHYSRTVWAKNRRKAIAQLRRDLLEGGGYNSITGAWPRGAADAGL